MATLGDLKARIITETNRSDLEDELADQLGLSIERAIDHHSDERFWFNQGSADAVATAAFVLRPAVIRIVERVSRGNCLLQKRPIGTIQHLSAAGEPEHYADYGAGIWLSPIPIAATLGFHGIAQVDAPADDNDGNIWTEEAYDLIAARTRFLLFRDVFRDVEGVQLAAQAEGEALDKLRRETRRRNVTPLRSPDNESWAAPFDINRGY